MSARSKARKRALDIIFEADSKSIPVDVVLAEHVRRREQNRETPLNTYTVTLVEGLKGNYEAIDTRIAAAADGWSLDRMPAVDRAILRIAVFEIVFGTDEVPSAVAISEAVNLATDLSTDESPAFINGVLSGVLTARQ
jgi:N utilization substance protein B